MNSLKEGDVRFYNGTPVTICSIDEAKGNCSVKWFVGTTLNEKTVCRQNVSLLPKEPQYSDYSRHLDLVHGIVCEHSASDGLVEFMLCGTVESFQEAFPELDRCAIIDAVYDAIHKLTDPFHYYLQCTAADGYEAAIQDVADKDELLAKELKEDVLKNSEEFER